MNRFSVWNQVSVSNEQHDRFGEAGFVHQINPSKPDQVAVKFDIDGVIMVVDQTDLKAL